MAAVLKLPCARCGEGVEVDQQTINTAFAMGDHLTVEHGAGECPGETPLGDVGGETRTRTFRVQISMWEIPDDRPAPDTGGETVDETLAVGFAGTPIFMGYDTDGNEISAPLLAGTGHTVTAPNFPEAVNGPITTWLNATWPKMMENAAIADMPDGG